VIIEQILLTIGATIFALLGIAHWVLTFYSNKFHPYDNKVTEAMKSTFPVLTKQTTMWQAWLGFNASHSLGAIIFAAVYMPLALFHFDLIRNSVWFLMLPVLIGFTYLVLAKRYWFKTPFIGLSVATVCFISTFVIVMFKI